MTPPWPRTTGHGARTVVVVFDVVQGDQAGQEGGGLATRGEANQLLEGILLGVPGKVGLRLLVEAGDLWTALRQQLVEPHEVPGVVRLLADDARHVLRQFRVLHMRAGPAHRGDRVALEARNVDAQRVDEHGEHRTGAAPHGFVRFDRIDVEGQWPYGELVHRMVGKCRHALPPWVATVSRRPLACAPIFR